MIKYRLNNPDGSYEETTSLEVAQAFGNYETINEEIQITSIIVPSEVPLWKLRFILGQMGLEDAVSAAINQLPEPTRSAGSYLWSLGTAVERYSPTVSLIKQALNIDDTQADQIFVNADLIVL